MFRLHPLSLVLPLLGLISGAEALVKKIIPKPDPFKDPTHDPYNPLRYIASNTLTGIGFGESG